MWFCVVCNLVTNAGSEREYATVFQFSDQLTFEAQQHMTFGAPMIRHIPGRVLDHTYTYISNLLRSPKHLPAVGRFFNSFHLRPIRQTKCWLRHLHVSRLPGPFSLTPHPSFAHTSPNNRNPNPNPIWREREEPLA
jgi:hypothetical protein